MLKNRISKYPRISLYCSVAACSLALVAAAGESVVPRFAAQLQAGQNSPVVVCFGDSVTGVYYHTGGRRAYTRMLAIALEQESPDVSISAINAGISGHTTADALARIDRNVLAHNPDLVTIMFGLNDMTRVPIEAFKENLITIIQRCRAVGAEVLLCTPNSVSGTDARPISKLEEYVTAVREVANTKKAPLADCYRAFEDVRNRDELEWAFLMSDDIHPNMDGHKLIAEVIAEAVLGHSISLANAGPIPLAIPNTMELLSAGKPILVMAMPPYDALIKPAVRAVWPDADVTVETWPIEGKTVADIRAHSKTVRTIKPNLVIIAEPATAESTRSFIQGFSWMLNNSISFGHSKWDCIAVPPSLAKPNLSGKERELDEHARRLIRAQDLSMIERGEDKAESLHAVLAQWLERQRAIYERDH